ncbi:MAG TPA: CPBP family intramembrane glutamic endopeptidase [Kofleriaceae bacterium]|nr:CPBP family intramembrane glutamic endopeptidase [Kofleriaceae bacterium]
MKSAVGVVLAVGCACLPFAAWEHEFDHLVLYELTWWLLVAGVLAYVRFVERRPLASVGFTAPHARGIALGMATGVAMLGVLAAIYAVGPDETGKLAALTATPLWWRVISVVRAAVGEELVFRGYAIERLSELTGRRGLAATASCAIFAIAHVGTWGWSHLIVAGAGGAMLTALYLWRRNLWINIVAHAIVDMVAVLQ